jgi:hypothetical protein
MPFHPDYPLFIIVMMRDIRFRDDFFNLFKVQTVYVKNMFHQRQRYSTKTIVMHNSAGKGVLPGGIRILQFGEAILGTMGKR